MLLLQLLYQLVTEPNTTTASTTSRVAAPAVILTEKQKKAAAKKELDERRIAHIFQLINGHDFINGENTFIIEDGHLKSILGTDLSHFQADQLWRICTKLGYTSRSLTKADCVKSIIAGSITKSKYDAIQDKISAKTDNTCQRTRMINVLCGDKMISQFEGLGNKKHEQNLMWLELGKINSSGKKCW